MGDHLFRDAINGPELEYLASVYSPMTARMARDAGFKYGIVGGSIASMALLGSPDLSLLTLTELVEFVRKISQSSSLRIIVDGDGGYGNALNAMRLVTDLEQAGASAVTLEDSMFPLHYQHGSTRLVNPEEHAAKLRSAVEARTSDTFGIIARTSVIRHESLDRLLARIALYASTGTDAICLTGVEDMNILNTISRSTHLPLMLIRHDKNDTFSQKELYDKNVKLYLAGHHAFEASVVASYQSYLFQRDNTRVSKMLSTEKIMSTFSNEKLYLNTMKEFM